MTSLSSWKDLVRVILPWKVYWSLKRIREGMRARVAGNDLNTLAGIYKTDKAGTHFYTPVYQEWFYALRNQPVHLLEIGVGGYEKPLLGGDSLRMWKQFFRKGKITGIDVYDKSVLQEDRIRIYKGDQADREFLLEVNEKEGPFNIIIDDGSHIQSDIIASFETLFPLMAPGGIYVIEDTQTSYWPNYGGSTHEMNTVDSAMNYFINRIHGLNHVEWKKEEAPINHTNETIDAIAFYHNLIFITKKK